GKSSLLNALLGEERAIVSDVAGTTRDVIEERFAIDGVAVRVLDTAGLHASDEPIERIGIARARDALASSAIALVVVDGARPLDRAARDVLCETRNRVRVVLFNKRDLGSAGYDAREDAERNAIAGSVFDAATLDAVRRAIARAGWHGETVDLARPHLASARQADAVARALESLAHAGATLGARDPVDLVVPDLLAAAAALGEITGAAATEAMLDGVFARFCVGK
ncbi:MAG TPA: GTPase, partial [Candidatus Elarobacter sp.]|nr:GTPase [Candidatus Elarobacter sp.]